MKAIADQLPRKIGRRLLAGCLLVTAILLITGCAGPEGGSSIPWAEPESWENQPNFGVPY